MLITQTNSGSDWFFFYASIGTDQTTYILDSLDLWPSICLPKVIFFPLRLTSSHQQKPDIFINLMDDRVIEGTLMWWPPYSLSLQYCPGVPVMLNMWKLFCLNFPIAMGCQSIFFRAEKIPSKKAAGIYIQVPLLFLILWMALQLWCS